MLRCLLFVFLLACINQSINGQATENDQVLAIIGTTLSPHIVFNGHFTTNPASQVGGSTNYLWMLQDSRDDAPTQALHKGIVKFDGTTNQYIDLSAVTGANSCGQRVGTFGGVNPAVPADRVGASFEIVVKFDAIANWAKAFDLSTAAGIDSMTLTWDGSSDNLGRILVEQYVNVTTIRSINWDKANMEWFRPTLSEWYHLAIVQKPAVTNPSQAGFGSGYWYLYINGQLWALADKISPGASLTPTQTANYPQRVTRNSQWLAKSSWADPNMAMTVDAFRVYDFALTTSEVGQLAAIYGLNKSSYALPTPALNQPMPTDYPENNKHRTPYINFDPFFKVDFATNPRSYVGGALSYEWLQVDPADSAADQAQHTGILRTNGEASSYVDLMAATGPNSAGKVMPTLFDGSSGTGDAYGWTIDIVVKPLGPITSQVWSKFFSLGSGPDVDAIFMGWVADSNSFEVGNYINARDDLKYDRLGYMTFYRAPTLNRWTHLTVVMQPKNPGTQPLSSYNATWTIYVDGQMVGRNNLTTNYPTPVVRRYSALARSNWQLDANIRMEMDVFRVWDRALDANQVESLAVAYGIDAVDGGDWAWKQALGTARAPRYNLDFQYHPSQNGGGPTGWTWSEQDPTDPTVIAGQHTGLCILDGSATSFVDLDATTGPNRVYDNLVMPMVGGPTAPGNNLIAGWTIELVFKATNWNSWAKIISLSNRQDEDEIMIGFDQEDGNMIVQNYITDNVYNAWAYAAVEVMKPTQLNKWYHLVVTMRPGTVPGAGNWQIYVNGQLQNWADRLMAGMTFTEGQGASYPRAVDRPNSFLGKSNWPNDANMRVIVDAFRIYDYVITQEQVTAFASAYGCNERVHINSPSDNVNLPVTTETNNWRAAGIATPPIFNAIFPNDPATFNQNNGVTDFKWLQSDPNDAPEEAAFHQGVIVFNGSGSCWADLNQVRGPKTIGLVAPIIGGVGSGTGATRGVTFELVVKLTSVLGWGKLFMLASGPNLDAYSMGWNGNNYDTIETQNWNSIKSGLVQKGAVQILASPPLNRWMHIVVVLQLTDDTKWEGLWTAYVDGEVVARKTATETPFPANFPLPVYRQHSTIAKSAWPGDPTAVMVLDMMRIHDYCLTQDQIRGTARQYGLYGDSRPNPAPTNITREFPDTAESTAARSAVGRPPVFNAWFGTNPQPTVAPSATLGYTWVERDDTDTPADQAVHRGIVKFNGAASSFIDMTTNRGPNSCGVVLPMIGGPGSGSASDKTQGWTFEIVFKITRMDSWAKLFNIGGGAEIAVIGLGVDGTDRTTMNAEVFDRLQTEWPHGFTEYMTPVMGKWYHAVWQIAPVNMTSGSAMWYFYVNGQLLNWSEQLATKSSFTPVQGANYPRYTERRFSYIGKSNWAADPFFSGAVDAMRVYDYLLTEKQITDLAKQYGCYDTSLMINTPAQNSALVNPENQAEVKIWDREGISAPVFNGNFAVDPRLHLGGATSSYQYTWMETDPLDTPADKNAHKGLLYIDGTPSQFIDLMRPSGPNSVGLVIPTLFGRGSGEGNQRGWTVELVFKCQRAETWSKFVNLATGGGDFFDSWAVSWFGDVRGTWMIQNYNNYNPIPGQLVEKGAMKFLNTPEIGRWYHLTAVMQPLPPYSRWGAVWRVYLDGTLVNRTTTENFPMPVVRDNSAIGRSQWGDQDPNSRMTVDALRIYDKALTPTQVAALARAYGVASPTVIAEPDLPVDPNDFGGGQGGGGNGGGNPPPSGGSTSNSSLGGGAIAGIVIGCVVGAAVLCALVFCFCLPGVRSGKKHIDSDGHKNTAAYDEMEASRQSQMDHDEVEMGETA